MKYDEFKDYLVQQIPAALPAKYADVEVILEKRYKVNQVLESFTIVSKPSKEDGNVISAAPTFYFKELYDMYQHGAELESLISYIVSAQDTEIPQEIKSCEVLDFDKMIRKITLQLINHERNEELLKTVIHQDFLDLAVVYRIEIKHDEDGIASTLVNPQILESWGISKETLHDVAVKNTRRELPTMFKNPIEIEEMEEDECGLYVLSNTELMHGASELIFDDVLQKASEVIGGDFYVLPSSIHEVFLLSTEAKSAAELKSIVEIANADIVPEEVYLSDNVYFYDTKENMLKIA